MAVREISFFKPQATRRRMVKTIHRIDDDYGLYSRFSITSLSKGNFVNPESYLTKYSKKYIETHKHMYRFKQILFGKWTIHKLEMPYYQVILMVMTLQLSINRMIRMNEMYLLSGRRNAFLTHIFASFIIRMPLFAYFMFMGYYSKKCFIRYWQTTPIFRGVAFSIIILILVRCGKDMTTFVTTSEYLIGNGNGIQWNSCKWANKMNQECLSRNKTFYINKTNGECPTTFDDFPPYIYYKENREDYSTRMIILFIAAIILFLGLMLFKKIKMFICIFNGCLIAVIFSYMILRTHQFFLRNHWDYYPLRIKESSLQLQICLQFISELIFESLPCCFLTYASKMKYSVKSTSLLDSILIFMVVTTSELMTQIWLSVNVFSFAKMHKIENCVFTNYKDFIENKLFCVINLEVIASSTFGSHFVSIYLLGIAYWSLVVPLCNLYAVVETILDAYIHLIKYKLTFFVGVTVAIFGLAALRCFNVSAITNGQSVNNMKYMTIFLVVLHLAIYSTKRFSTDYHFTYGQTINKFGITIYKLGQVLCILFAITYMVIMTRELTANENYGNAMRSQVAFYAGIILIILYGVWAVMVEQQGSSMALLLPEPRWGPNNPIMKANRRQFDKNKEMIRMNFACTHHCLRESVALQRQMTMWYEISKYLKRKFENAKDP